MSRLKFPSSMSVYQKNTSWSRFYWWKRDTPLQSPISEIRFPRLGRIQDRWTKREIQRDRDTERDRERLTFVTSLFRHLKTVSKLEWSFDRKTAIERSNFSTHSEACLLPMDPGVLRNQRIGGG